MEPFYSAPRELLPAVLLNKNSGKFQIIGTSCPMDPFEFFDPIMNWFDDYSKDPLQKTVFELNLKYFNTSTSKFLLRILFQLEEMQDNGYDVKVKWYYSEEDEDMLEEGEEFENIVDIDFDLIPIDDDETEKNDDDFYQNISKSTY